MDLENQIARVQTTVPTLQHDSVQPQKQHDTEQHDSIALKQREHQLIKDKMLAEEKLRNYTVFLSSHAHDLRSPFTVIMGYAEMFSGGFHRANGEDYTKEYAASILSSSQHLLNLINDILDVCNIDAEQLQLFETPTDVRSLIEDAELMVHERGETKNLNFVISIAPDLCPIFIDHQRIRQALVNILSNSVKFTARDGRIDLSAFRNSQGDLEIHVSDDGLGMSKENIAKALTEFGKVHNGENSCTGLGLPLAHRLVTLHGGTIELSSEINRGTTVILTLPASRWQDHSQ